MEKTGRFLKIPIAAITGLCIISYAYLLITLFLSNQFIYSIIIPAAGFVICTGIRNVINAPRPYEKGEGANLIGKTTKGKSFPSRHVFSIFMIAMTVFVYISWLGIILFVLGVILAVLRVMAGVHYIKDVVAGALLAIAVGSVLLLLPG